MQSKLATPNGGLVIINVINKSFLQPTLPVQLKHHDGDKEVFLNVLWMIVSGNYLAIFNHSCSFPAASLFITSTDGKFSSQNLSLDFSPPL